MQPFGLSIATMSKGMVLLGVDGMCSDMNALAVGKAFLAKENFVFQFGIKTKTFWVCFRTTGMHTCSKFCLRWLAWAVLFKVKVRVGSQ